MALISRQDVLMKNTQKRVSVCPAGRRKYNRTFAMSNCMAADPQDIKLQFLRNKCKYCRWLLLLASLQRSFTRGVVPWTQKLRTPSAATPELSKVLSLKPWVRQNIALHVSPAASNSIFNFCLSGPFSFLAPLPPPTPPHPNPDPHPPILFRQKVMCVLIVNETFAYN